MKRLVSLLLILVVCFCASCSLKKGQDVQIIPNGPFYDSHTVDITYSMNTGSGSNYDIEFGDDIYATMYVNWTIEQERAVFNWTSSNLFYTQGMPTDNNGEISVSDKVLLLYDYSGTLISDVNLNDLMGDFYDVPKICIDDRDNVHVLVTSVTFDTIEYTYFHLVFDSTGNLISNVQLFVDEYYAIQQILSIENELVVLCRNDSFEESVLFFSSDGTINRKANNFHGVIEKLYSINDIVYAKASFMDNSNTGVVGLISLEKFIDNNFSDYFDISNYYNPIFESNGGVIFLSNDEIIYLNITNGETTCIASIGTLDLGIYCTYLHMNTNGEIVAIGTGYLDTSYGMAVIVSSDTDVNADKQVIYAAGIGIKDDPIIRYMKFQYNNSHLDSRIELIDYYDVYGYSYSDSELYETITNDLLFGHLQGDTPDILIDKGGMFPLYSISNENYLYDLSDLFSMNISESDYNTNIVDTSLMNGQLFSVSLGYTVTGLMTYSNNLNTSCNWNIRTFENIANNSNIQMIPNLSAEELLVYQLQGTYEDYFDINSSEVNFDSDNFRLLLSWANEFSDNIYDKVSSPYMYYIQDGMHYCEFVNRINVQSLFVLSETIGQPISVVGFPSVNDASLIAVPEYRFAILSDSDYCDEFWDFIMYGYDNVAQQALSRVVFPVSYSALNYGIEYTANYYLPENPINDRNVITNNVNEMLNRINCVSQYDPQVFSVICEESRAYFSGDKSIDEVCDLIQNRCEIIMSERYG